MNRTSNWHYFSATDLVNALRTKQLSALELLEYTIHRVESLDDKINALPVRDFERARLAAKAADAAISRGEFRPLTGLPVSIKESYNIAGLPTTWGDPQYQNWCPAEDALAVSRLKAAGAVIIGKTNVPFMLKDWQTYNPLYGVTNNPWNKNMTPGGSSGGSAAALAAGYVSMELGSDMAGSLRVPANYCGVCAHKPTQDLIPLRGAAPPTTQPLPTGADLVVAGPMARNSNDLELALSVLAGPDDMLNGKGFRLDLPQPRHNRLDSFRVLFLDSHPLCPTSIVIQQAIDETANKLVHAGVAVSRDVTKLPDLAYVTQTYTMFFAALSGVSLPADAYEELKLSKQAINEKDNSLHACRLRGFTCSYRDWFLASRRREELRKAWRNSYKEFDVILCPVMPTPAFPHDHSSPENRMIEIDGKKVPYYDQLVWVSIATLFGLPATVIPVSKSDNGLPIGMQIIGDYFEDTTTLTFAKLYEREFGGFVMPEIK